MATGSRPVSERLRSRLSEALIAVYFAVAPSSVEPWRVLPQPRVAAVLAVGEPTPLLADRTAIVRSHTG